MSLAMAHIIGSKTLGGAERFYLRLIEALHARGERVTAMLRRGSEVVAQVPAGIAVVESPMRTVWDPFSRRALARALEAIGPEIVQTYMGRATRLTHVRKPGPVHIARLGGFYKLDGYRHADVWIGNTHAVCDYLRAGGFPASRVFYVPNFVDVAPASSTEALVSLRAQLHLPADAAVVLGAGRLIEKKGFEHLVDAFARLPGSIGGRPVYLVILGAGELLPRLQAFAHERGVEARVRWPGWQTDPDPYYALADVFVCPSLHEPLGNVILEAWSHQRAVISTETDGARELIRSGDNGLLVPIADAAGLATQLQVLLRDASARRAFGAAGARDLRKRFGRDAVVDAYLDLYRRLLGGA